MKKLKKNYQKLFITGTTLTKMAFALNICLKDALVIKSERVYLELLLSEKDKDDLLELCKKNFKDDYIKSLYGENPKYIDFSHTVFQVSTKFSRNHNYNDDSTKFTKLYYVVKLNTGEIIGTFEIYGSGTNCVEFGLFIDQEHSRQHYGTQVLNTAIEFLKNNSSIGTIKWECNADNAGSTGVAKKCGFIHSADWEIYKGRTASTFLYKM